MFRIEQCSDGQVKLWGRLDAFGVDLARPVLARVGGRCRVDCAALEYVASAGIGLLVATHRRLIDQGAPGLELVNLSSQVRELLQLAGLGYVFELG
ncbi:MAG: STAS domain-containing protein [Candidatus Krumholzibacteriia bacterium]